MDDEIIHLSKTDFPDRNCEKNHAMPDELLVILANLVYTVGNPNNAKEMTHVHSARYDP